MWWTYERLEDLRPIFPGSAWYQDPLVAPVTAPDNISYDRAGEV